MKHKIFLILLAMLNMVNAQNRDTNYNDLWEKVYKEELNLLPKSALVLVHKIYDKADKQGNEEQKIKCMLYQSKFALTLEENAQLKVINNFKKAIETTANKVSKAVLQNLVAHMYWEYFQKNRWRIYNRTKTAKKITGDFRTWDVKTLYTEIHKHFNASLKEKNILQRTKTEVYDELINRNEENRNHKSSLFDFLAHNALDFYKEKESSITQPKEPFVIDKVLFLQEIETHPFKTKDTLSTKYLSLKIYQELLQFHKKEKNTIRYIKVLLEAVNYIENNSSFDNFKEEKLAFFINLKKEYKSTEASAFIEFEIAKIYFDLAKTYHPKTNTKHQFDFEKSLSICDQISKEYPNHILVDKCKNLVATIEKKGLQCTIENYIPIISNGRALVRYTNVESAFFTIYKVSEESYKRLKEERDRTKKRNLLKQLPKVHEWKVQLPNKKDHQEHKTEILLPKVPQGRYLLMGKIDKQDSNLNYQVFQVTNLTFVSKGNGEFQVLHRENGSAIKDAKVNLKNESYGRRNRTIDKNFITDNSGLFTFINREYYNNVTAKVRALNDEAFFEGIYLYNNDRDRNSDSRKGVHKAFVFTDRSIYRPGQKVYFKTIVLHKYKNETRIVANEKVEIGLYDVNNQEIKKIPLELNEFGTVASEFKLPTAGLNGVYSFKVFMHNKSLNYIRTHISVEEYKRPKFETSFKPLTGVFKVNDSVKVKGTATALSGSKITGAKVQYRVVRKARYPRWCWWISPKSPVEIELGETTTDENGDYKVVFKAFPDVSVEKKNQPTFYYTIFADVTDINGETRSTETEVAVGYHTLKLNVSIADKLNAREKNSITIDSENLNGEFTPTVGTVKIYKLVAPEKPLRSRTWGAPDIQTFSKEKYAELFPHEPYNNEMNDSKNWKKGKLVFDEKFDTQKQKEIALGKTKNWSLGKYMVVTEAKDKFGQLVKEEEIVSVYNPKTTEVADHKMFEIYTDRSQYEPLDFVTLSVGSASRNMTVFVEVEKNHKTFSTHQILLKNNIQKIKIPVTEQDRGGFAIKWHWVNYNTMDSGVLNISVPYKSTELSIETLTFRDLLEPGAKQKWSFKIKGPDKEKATAEILASMYDASLDQFKPHAWNFNPIQLPIYRTSHSINKYNNFSNRTLSIREAYRNFYDQNRLSKDEFNWFGFSFVNNTWKNRQYLKELKLERSEFDKRIIGTVTDQDFEPLIGVNISIKNTKYITISDFDGHFEIKVKKEDMLVFDYLGYKSKEISLGNSSNLNIILEENASQLEEVVIIGYGTQKKREVTGAVTRMSSETLSKRGVSDIGNALQGQIAGVNITNANGTPGEASNILIRGYSSLSNDGKKLYIVDGVPFENDPGLSVEEIESIDVLKDAASIAIYGARGVNGVIVITTKKGGVSDSALNDVKARTNFNETAFFFPQLKTDENGDVSFEFTMPEDLTKWKLQLLAHDKQLNTGTKTLTTVTQKQLMVIPNVPRFLREGDVITLSTKIANLNKETLSGKVKLELTDAVTGKNIDALLQNKQGTQLFNVAAKGNTAVSWELHIPENIMTVQYKIVAATKDFSDGEQNVLPVLSNRMLVTESLPLWVNGNQTKTFSLDGLKKNTSQSLKNHQLTLEITSNPAWYAVQALPYLMEYPHECAEQTFARYYANQLASHIVNSNPKIKEVFHQWANSDALISNLEKNQELKSIIIQETPWLRDAQSETEQKKRIALLFDLSKMENNLNQIIKKLDNMQFANGGFPWFKGSRYPSRNITQHIVQGFAHLKQLGVKINHKKLDKMIDKAESYLDDELVEDYRRLLERAAKIKGKSKTEKEGEILAKKYLKEKHLYSTQLQYLYIISFDEEKKTNGQLSKAIAYYSGQAVQFWKEESLYNKGLLSLIHFRSDRKQLADSILKSLEENSITSDEMGMYWKENKASWSWYQSPIETQSLLIEAFSEIENKTETVDNLKKWLLKNKQTQQWKTTKATSEAVYALLLQGSDWLAIDDAVEITIGGKELDIDTIENVEAGTGYFKTKWAANEITSAMATVSLTKKEKGVAWGGLYWQYFEDLNKIKSANTPLKILKKVFKKTNTEKGPLLTQVMEKGELKVGDLLTVRIELSTDRDMEFIHMKDMRAAGLEPVSVLSGYKWQDRLGYYQSTKDASTHFFFDSIRKGIYVFEYDVRVSHKGTFSNGITTVQSMYAPEFSSHSDGIIIKVK